MRKAGFLAMLLGASFLGAGQFTILENATSLSQNCVQLTPANNTQSGAAWHDCTLDLDFPFTLELTVNLGTNNGGADGIALLLQQNGPNAPTSSNGGNMGYGNFEGGITVPPSFSPSLIIEFDTWQNGWAGDPSYDHIAVQRDGTADHTGVDCLTGCFPNNIQASATNGNIEDGNDHDVFIEWDPVTQGLRLEFDGTERFDITVDLAGDVFAGESEVWWGFTGSTGGASNNQSFCLIEYTNPTTIPGLATDPPDPITLCAGSSIASTVVAAPGWTPTWANTGTDTQNIAAPGDYLVEAVGPDGCPAQEYVTVAQETAPNLSSESPVALCDGASGVLTANAAPGSDLDWDGTGSSTLAVNAAGFHTVTATLNSCTEQVTVEVVSQPLPVLSIAPATDIELCTGESQLVAASTDIPANITWYQNGAALAGTEQLIASSGNWIIEAEALGCAGTPVVVQSEVLVLPSAEVSSIPDVLCWNETGLVYAVPAGGTTVENWVLPAGTPNPNQAGPGMYTAFLVEESGCTDEVTYFLNALPPIAFSLEGPAGACEGETVTLSVSGNQESIAWSTGETSASIALEAADGAGPFTVEVGLSGCTETAQTTVGWWPVPSVGALADTVTRCVLDPAVEWTWPAQAAPAEGWWVWSVNGLTTTGGPVWEAEGNYTVRVLDSMTGCADSTYVYVNVLPNLDVNAAPYAGLICWGETTEVLAELKAVEGTDIAELPYTLTWSDPELEGLNPSVGAGTYLLSAENACGLDVAVVEVTQEYCGCDMWVPTAFTPDNDGINDGFNVETNCPELDEFLFQVFDRWGELVWATEDPEATWRGEGNQASWMDGNHFVPDGIYGYRLFWKFGDLGIPRVEERHGSIHILR